MRVRKSLLPIVASATGMLCAAALAAPLAADAAAGKQPRPVVVVSGLNNPRQLSLVGAAELLIAEAGRGGTTPQGASPEGGPQYAGRTGSISAVLLPARAHNTAPNRVVTGLMSVAAKDGSQAVGSDGVSSRNINGPIFIQETFTPPAALPKPLASTQNGRLLRAQPYGSHLARVANISGFERHHDPDRHGFDSDPYAVLALKDGLLVADAAGNDVLWVQRGHIRLFHTFPNVRTGACASQADPGPKFPGCNFVPTSLAVDGQGHVYVGGLSSLTPRQGRVVELSANGKKVLRTWRGFSAVTGVAVGHGGKLYVSQLFGVEAHPAGPGVTGVLTRIDRNGARRNLDVPFPAGIALDRTHVYVAAYSIAPSGGLGAPGTSGQVWRYRW